MRRPPFISRLLQKIAPTIGATVHLEPKYGYVGQIIYPNGHNRYFRATTLDINTTGAAKLAKDKGYCAHFLNKEGFPTPPGEAFFSKEWAEHIRSDRTIDAAWAYAEKLGLPVFVKPNSKSQGKGVEKVASKEDFYRALNSIFEYDKVALVQRPVAGKDYRIVVLDNEVISAYERIPLAVVGDGVSNLRELLDRKQAGFIAIGRDTLLKKNDPRIQAHLVRNGREVDAIPLHNERVSLLDNANLSTGGESVDVTEIIHPLFADIAISVTKKMGLRLCGVDIIVDGDISQAPQSQPNNYWVIEINSSPGLDHYAAIGKKQEEIVEKLYTKVLIAMGK